MCRFLNGEVGYRKEFSTNTEYSFIYVGANTARGGRRTAAKVRNISTTMITWFGFSSDGREWEQGGERISRPLGENKR